MGISLTVMDKFARSIKKLPQQCRQAYEESLDVALPSDYQDVERVVICGMGGSALGPEIVKDNFGKHLAIPLQVNRRYTLPYQVDGRDLVVLSSYSGNTEEVLSCGGEALRRGARIIVVTTGGKLAELAGKETIPLYQFEPRYNPSQQPRLGLGYSVFGIIGLFSKLGLVNYGPDSLEKLSKSLEEKMSGLQELGEEISCSLQGRVPLLVGAEHLRGATHAVNNCLNENSKTLSAFFYLPELNHHLMEGLSFPLGVAEKVVFLMFNSRLYLSQNQARFRLTRQGFEQENYSTTIFLARSDRRLAQGLEVVAFGWWLAYYLSGLNKVEDPLAVPQVEELKKHL